MANTPTPPKGQNAETMKYDIPAKPRIQDRASTEVKVVLPGDPPLDATVMDRDAIPGFRGHRGVRDQSARIDRGETRRLEGKLVAAEQTSMDGWTVCAGSTKTVYDPDTGAPSEQIVSPWIAEWVGGGAKLYAGNEDALRKAIAAHPYTNGRAPKPVAVETSVTPESALEARIAALEAAAGSQVEQW